MVPPKEWHSSLLLAAVEVTEVVCDVVGVVTGVVVSVVVAVEVKVVVAVVVTVVSLHPANVFDWKTLTASLRTATAAQSSLKSLIKPVPLHPNASLTKPREYSETAVFNACALSKHVAAVVCKIRLCGVTSLLHAKATSWPVQVLASSSSRSISGPHRKSRDCET